MCFDAGAPSPAGVSRSRLDDHERGATAGERRHLRAGRLTLGAPHPGLQVVAVGDNAVAVMWGAEDLFAVLGGTANRYPDGTYREVARHVRSHSLLAAKAHGRLALDSVYLDIKDLDGESSHRHVAFGQVVGIHIDDRLIKDGRVDTAAMRPIARCGYGDYAVVDKVIPVVRPRDPDTKPKVQAAE